MLGCHDNVHIATENANQLTVVLEFFKSTCVPRPHNTSTILSFLSLETLSPDPAFSGLSISHGYEMLILRRCWVTSRGHKQMSAHPG